jgi:hypothetical protein
MMEIAGANSCAFGCQALWRIERDVETFSDFGGSQNQGLPNM